MRRLVIVGNGKAGDAFLRQIQKFRRDFMITVFSGGKASRPLSWYQTRGFDLRAGITVTSIDRHARLVQGNDGSRTTYDRLILATGHGQLRPTGLVARDRIIVNRSLETSDGHIYAIGDCAEVCDDFSVAVPLDHLARKLAARLSAEAQGVELVPTYKNRFAARNLTVVGAGERRALTA